MHQELSLLFYINSLSSQEPREEGIVTSILQIRKMGLDDVSGASLSSHGYEVEGLRIFTPLPVVSPWAHPDLFIQQMVVVTGVMSLTHWLGAGRP